MQQNINQELIKVPPIPVAWILRVVPRPCCGGVEGDLHSGGQRLPAK